MTCLPNLVDFFFLSTWTGQLFAYNIVTQLTRPPTGRSVDPSSADRSVIVDQSSWSTGHHAHHHSGQPTGHHRPSTHRHSLALALPYTNTAYGACYSFNPKPAGARILQLGGVLRSTSREGGQDQMQGMRLYMRRSRHAPPCVRTSYRAWKHGMVCEDTFGPGGDGCRRAQEQGICACVRATATHAFATHAQSFHRA